MLPLQPTVHEDHKLLKIKALIGAFCVYCSILFCIFFMGHQHRGVIKLSVNKIASHDLPVLFLSAPPRGSRVAVGVQGRASVQKKSSNINGSKSVVAQKKPVQKPVQKKLSPNNKKAEIAAQTKKDLVSKNTLAESQQKSQKASAMKKIEKKPELVPKDTIKPPRVEPVQIKPAQLKPIKPVSVPPVARESHKIESQKVLPPAEQNLVPEPVIPEQVYVQEGYDQGTKAQMALSRAIGRNWHPPHGLGDTLSAKLQVIVAADGAIMDIVIQEKSGVVAYGLAARGALWRSEYPKDFWGKTVEILFGVQS